ncbi:unnamed protein product [Paramecium octaurelia]|uniref:Uncharacterized protein n=1 Tax=Paramecium octaurelia TaxID=43137 RepID=A0A8S1UTI8_PAROT|nr:unnamed protein product [Paramecium octaurelia]
MLHFSIIIFQHLAQIQSRRNSTIKDNKSNYAYGIQLDRINILVSQKVIFKELTESLWYLTLQIKTVSIVLVIIGLNKSKNVRKQIRKLFWLAIKAICAKNDKSNSLKSRSSHRNTNCLILKSGSAKTGDGVQEAFNFLSRKCTECIETEVNEVQHLQIDSENRPKGFQACVNTIMSIWKK